MALNKLKGNLERMLDKNLADLVRGIRNNKENEVRLSQLFKHKFNLKLFSFFKVKYIAQAIEEIKQELKQDNIVVKANAISKLTYVLNQVNYY